MNGLFRRRWDGPIIYLCIPFRVGVLTDEKEHQRTPSPPLKIPKAAVMYGLPSLLIPIPRISQPANSNHLIPLFPLPG